MGNLRARGVIRGARRTVLTLLFALLATTAWGQDDAGTVGSLTLELVADGFTTPVAIVHPPDDGRLFVVDQVGTISIIDENGQKLDQPFLDVSDRMVDLQKGYDERGLLGLAFHPNYAQNGRFYVYYSAPLAADAPDGWDNTSHVSEFQVSKDDPNRADPDSERVLLAIDEPQLNHNGGALAFGPDGYLYISLGDGGQADDVGPGHPPLGNGQDVTTLLGSILRIDVNAENAGQYGIPEDNPLVGAELPEGPDFAGDQPRPEIYAWGFRNPFRFSFDRKTGDLWVGDVGQNLFEEIDRITKPGNYGWHLMEGSHPFDPDHPNTVPDEAVPETGPLGMELIPPVLEYAHPKYDGSDVEKRGTTVIGGYVYRGDAIPELQGDYVFGDWNGGVSEGPAGKLFVASGEGDDWSFAGTTMLDHYVVSLGEDAKGELYVGTTDSVGPAGDTGAVYRITGTGGND